MSRDAGEGGVLRLALAGRATGEAVAGLRRQVEAALDGGTPFVVLFDRRALTAPTADGHAELERWGRELTPRMPRGCLAWADLYDERRAASLARGTDGATHLEYPQRVFGDEAEAERWLLAHLAGAPPAASPST